MYRNSATPRRVLWPRDGGQSSCAPVERREALQVAGKGVMTCPPQAESVPAWQFQGRKLQWQPGIMWTWAFWCLPSGLRLFEQVGFGEGGGGVGEMRQAEGSKRYKLRTPLHPSQSLPPALLPLPRPATSALLSEFVQEAEEAWPGDGG